MMHHYERPTTMGFYALSNGLKKELEKELKDSQIKNLMFWVVKGNL
jgi:hypothetical protein